MSMSTTSTDHATTTADGTAPRTVPTRRALSWRRGRAVAIAAAFALTFLLTDYVLSQLAITLALALAVLSLNLLTGYTGLISVGHGALMGIGGYATVSLAVNAGVPYPLGLLAGMVLCGVAGLILGLPSLRLSGLYLALVTLGFAIIFPALLKRWEPVTGGVSGLLYLTPEAPGPLPLTSAQWIFILTLAGFVTGAYALRRLVTGRTGRALSAIRRSELMAAANGIPVGRIKLTVFTVSACIAGLAGGLYQLAIGSALPDTYVVTFSIMLLAAAVVGGVRSIVGALVGAAFIVWVPDYASMVGDRGPQLVVAIALMLVIYLAPGGVARASTDLFSHLTSRLIRR